MHTVSKDIFFHISSYLDVNEILNLGLINKKFQHLFRANIEKILFSKTGNSIKIDALYKKKPSPETAEWLSMFTKNRETKIKLRTVLMSNNIERIKLFKSVILENIFMSINLMIKYSSTETIQQIGSYCGICNSLIIALKSQTGICTTTKNVPMAIFIKYGYRVKLDYKDYTPDNLYYAWKKKRYDIFSLIVRNVYLTKSFVLKFLLNRQYSAVYTILPYLGEDSREIIIKYGDKRFINRFPNKKPQSDKNAAAGLALHEF